MNATFTSEQYQLGSKTVYLKYLTTNHRDLSLKYSTNRISDSSIGYGVNGTFFDKGNGNLTSMAIQDGEQIHIYGDYNRAYANGSTGMSTGTFVVLEDITPGGRFLFVKSFKNFPVVVGGETIEQSNVRFAIGGSNLFLDQGDITEDEFDDLIANEDFPVPDSKAVRTVILYIGGKSAGGNTILLTVYGDDTDNPGSYNGVTAWELRQIIREKWPNCIMGVNLDGGGSTQIAYKQSDGTRKWIAPMDGTNIRKVYSFITVPM